ncbi:hypothetical protein [Prosthecobacter dejongeii]|uniref:Uncharacterized protein n=1 Tax=Prosthecobacter dejongeii TaxID=48465 RepID=A0A7W7YJT4_9BACT|nr:hypothetical protein [Prosthecobacter dejongeii]MBB5037508.1 hypothetical protein [Prosthecobacter dejongeii]
MNTVLPLTTSHTPRGSTLLRMGTLRPTFPPFAPRPGGAKEE